MIKRFHHPSASPSELQPTARTVPVRAIYFGLSMMVGMLSPRASLAVDDATVVPGNLRRIELVSLVRQDCGACHGLTLKGGLGPPLLPETLLNKPVDSLKATILQGRPGTAMPPWQRLLSEADADWIVANLKRGFPNER